MNKIVFVLAVVLFSLVSTLSVRAQSDTNADLYDMPLEELMEISIVSASKKEEKLFDAPVSSYSISREDIRRAGVTSIPEALRLCPDLLVRETTHGNYDIHIRGLDNLASLTPTNMQINTFTLVMIDNRPVFNYIQGGTFWESLPVGLIDVERIEVVRGPAASLYGPNAVSGIINIITRKINEKKWHAAGHASYGLPGKAVNGSLSVGKKISNKLSLRVSGNYEDRQRLDDQHYLYDTKSYIPSEEYVKSKGGNFLESELALRKLGVNLFTDLQLTSTSSLQLSAGFNQASSQKIYFMNESPLTFNKLLGGYVNLQGKLGAFNSRVSFTAGSDDVNQLSSVYTARYDYQVVDADFSYELDIANWLSIVPSFSYYSSDYSDKAYRDKRPATATDWFGGIIDTEAHIGSMAGAIKADIRPFDQLRVLASGRVDKFTIKEDKLFSWQVSATYAPINDLLFRATYSRAGNGSFYGYNYLNSQYLNADGSIMEIHGNKELELTTNTLTEVGVRAKLHDRYQADVTFFRQQVDNIVAFQHEGQEVIGDRLYIMKGYYNPPKNEAIQKGVSVSLNMVPFDGLQFRPFITIQNTDITSSTPRSYGGFYTNLELMDRLNFNVNAYYFLSQEQLHLSDGKKSVGIEGNIREKFILNSSLMYRLHDKWNLALTGKNLLNKTSREYYGADRTTRRVVAGLSYNF